MTSPLVDLGQGHGYRRVSRYGDERGKWCGIIMVFPGDCKGAVLFDKPENREAEPERDLWTVESYVPLTLSPSILCTVHPEHHGYIREGLWVQA